MAIAVTEKKPTTNNCFIKAKSPFSVVEVSNTVTFEEMLVLASYLCWLQ